MYLPSRKFVLIMGSIMVAVGIVYLSSSLFTPRTTPSASIQAKETYETKKDSDGDGTEDWLEILEGTDPKDPASRKSERERTLVASLARQSVGTSTITNQFLEEYSAIVKSHISVDNTFDRGLFHLSPREQETLLQNLLAKTKMANPDQALYTRADIVTDETKKPIMYFNELGAVYQKYFVYRSGTFETDSDKAVFSKLRDEMKNKKVTDESIARVLALRGRYLKVVEEMKKISVPPQATDAHLGALNSLARVVVALTELSKIQEDPLLGMVGINRYVDAGIAMQKNDALVLALLKKNSILFKPGEFGYIVQAFAQTAQK